MDKTKPSSPTRAKRKPLPKVSKPEPLATDTDTAKPTSIQPKRLIGEDPDYVTTVGLGNLKVTTANGAREYNG